MFSVYQEILRTQTFYSGTQEVLQDTILDSMYLLKKGCHIMIPNNVIHFSNITWGPTASGTGYCRFMPSKKDSKTVQAPSTFRSSGDLPNFCPGRHFPSTDVTTILAIMHMRYDIAPENGRWDMPEKIGGLCGYHAAEDEHQGEVDPKMGLARGLDLQTGGSECKATVTVWMIMELRHDSK